MQTESVAHWARNQFGRAQLKDVRRTRRLVAMACAAARRPSGKVSVVFDRDEERAGAYDFLENPAIKADALAEMLFAATTQRAAETEGTSVLVILDGTALSITDEKESKGLGPVGSPNRAVRGLQVMNALAVAIDGVPLGLIDQTYWSRRETDRMSKDERTRRNQLRPLEDKEYANFLRAARSAVDRLAAVARRAWIVIDREADNTDILFGLSALNCDFTVRSKWDRRTEGPSKLSLRASLARQPSLGEHVVEVGRTGKRAARRAVVEVRAQRVAFQIGKKGTRTTGRLELTAIWAREVGGRGADALDWLLFTNVPVTTREEAEAIVDGYRKRWRVEEFHRTWKQGDCNVEDAQLRSAEAIQKWATILAAVATRIERLKYLARNNADAPATVELSDEEIEVLRRDQASRGVNKKRSVPMHPTIGEATRWIAELGGWIDQKSSGPPGSTTLGRGLERLSYLVAGHRLTRPSGREVAAGTIRLGSKGNP